MSKNRDQVPLGIGVLLLLGGIVVFSRHVFLIVHRGGASALSLQNIIASEPYMLLWPVLFIGSAVYLYFSNRNG